MRRGTIPLHDTFAIVCTKRNKCSSSTGSEQIGTKSTLCTLAVVEGTNKTADVLIQRARRALRNRFLLFQSRSFQTVAHRPELALRDNPSGVVVAKHYHSTTQLPIFAANLRRNFVELAVSNWNLTQIKPEIQFNLSEHIPLTPCLRTCNLELLLFSR